MKIGFGSFLAVTLCAATTFCSALPAPAAQRIIPNQQPPALANLTPLGFLPPSTPMHLAIGLPLRNQAGLDALLQQLYDPASPNFRHFLTPEQFTEQFGPSAADYAAILDFARTNGLTVTATFSNRILVDVEGSAANVERAFHVKMRTYPHPTEGRTFFAPDVAPSVDASLPILHVGGMDNFALPHPRFTFTPLDAKSPVTPNAGSGPAGLFWGYDFRNAYVPDVPLTGTGQTVGLLEFDGYFPNDIATYVSQSGLPSVPLQDVAVDGGVSTPGGGNGEVALDIDMAIAMAPGLAKIVVYEAPNPSPWEDLLNRMASDIAIKQFSCSWGGGLPSPTGDQIFQTMAAQGQSFMNASGDSDAFPGGVIPFPAESPYITQVGGTTLTTGSGGSWSSEKVWNWGGGIGSSGGISTAYPIPSWQQGISMSANQGSTTMRNIPDVALTADNIYVVADNGQAGAVGGTSAAAPLWAAFLALVNQQAAPGGSSVGFINPTIYSIAKGSSYTTDFHDIKTGNNFSPSSPTKFAAVTGYDLCTGLGTPNGLNLVYELAGRAPRTGYLQLALNPSSGSTLLNVTTQAVFVTVKDGGYDVTNATVTAVIPGVTNLTLLNNGTAPDAKANDAVYSAAFVVPASVTTLSMTVVASATNEIGATNVASYSVVPVPPNDNFANATKVPAGGATYLANNKVATIEPGEPKHDGDTNMAASLWWQWTPPAATNVFINTIGSKIDNVLAVYTGSTLSNLQPVAATNGIPSSFKPAYLSFNAQAGVTYRIAVASTTSNSLGSIVFQLAPGGQFDATAPVVAIANPLSGQTVTNRSIVFSGSALDPSPNAGGVVQVSVSVNGIPSVASGTTNWTLAAALQPQLNTITATAVDAAGNVSAPVTAQVNFLVPTVANDFFVNAIPLGGNSGVVSNSNVNATLEAGEPDIVGNPGGHSVWWLFTPTVDGVLTLNTTNSSFDTLLGIFTGPQVSDLHAVAENDDAYPGAPGGFSYLSQAVRSNVTYAIVVDGYDGATGNVSLSYSFAPATVYQLVAGNTSGGAVQLSTVNALGGVSILPGQSGAFAAGTTVTLTAIAGVNMQFGGWTGAVSSAVNPLAFVVQGNATLTANFVSTAFTDGFESGGFTHLTWVTGGDLPWVVQTNVVCQGIYAARSGAITNSQTSTLMLSTNFIAGTGSFDFKVSSETNWDYLKFYVDDILYKQWSGGIGWANYSFPLVAGWHTLKWSYVKDPSDYAGLDAAFIDDVNLPLGGTAGGPPPQLALQRQSDGSFVLTVSGQGSSQYITQTSTNLVDWQNLSTNYASGGIIQINIPANSTNQAQFYRAIAP